MTPLPESLLESVAAAAVREGLADAIFTRLPSPRVDADPDVLFRLVEAGYGQRRKMLRRSLSGLVDAAGFERAGVRPEARAEELTQDAFIELLRHWRTVAEYDRPDLWLRRVAIRKAQRERHRGWRRRELEVLAAPEEAVDGPPTPAPEVLAAVRRLAPGQRAVVVLFYFEDRPMSEIAEILGAKREPW